MHWVLSHMAVLLSLYVHKTTSYVCIQIMCSAAWAGCPMHFRDKSFVPDQLAAAVLSHESGLRQKDRET
jgi:hypothetical protein